MVNRTYECDRGKRKDIEKDISGEEEYRKVHKAFQRGHQKVKSWAA